MKRQSLQLDKLGVTKDKDKIRSLERLQTVVPSICIKCGINPVAVRKHGLCKSCYTSRYNHSRNNTKPKQPNTREALFIQNYFTHDQWVFQPATFRINGANYTPDFYEIPRHTFIEVVGSRQAYCFNRLKYDLFQKIYPEINFEVRLSTGNLLLERMGRLQFCEKSFGKIGNLSKLVKYDRFQEPAWAKNRGERSARAKLTDNQSIAIIKDDRRPKEIAQEYGITAHQVYCIKTGLRKPWLQDRVARGE